MRARTRIDWRVALTLALLLLLLGCTTTAPLATLPGDLPARVELAATPFHPQTVHECGPAAVATVLGAAGRDVAPDVLAGEVYLPGREGSLQPELAAAVRARGLLAYRTGAALADVMAEVAAGRPVLVLQRLGAGPWPGWHYAVVIGYDRRAERVLLRSGTRKRLSMRSAVFEATWERGGRWALVALEPGRLPAHPDLERYLQAAAALEATTHDLAAAHAAYDAAAGLWPDASLPRLGLGNVAAARGDWREAERWYAAVLAHDPADAAALNNRIEALLRLGCFDAARLALDRGAGRVAATDPLRPALEQTAGELAAAGTGRGAEPAECTQFTTR